MSTTTIRIEMKNNNDARGLRVLADFSGASRKHNGGKVVIATVQTGDLSLATDALESDNLVASYEVRS